MRENILPASTPVTLDGETYVLRYRAYAFIRYAEECGGDLLADLRELSAEMAAAGRAADLSAAPEPAAEPSPPKGFGWAFAKLRDVLWAGLVDAQPDMTRDRVSRMFGIADLPTLTPIMMQAFQMALPQASPARPTVPETPPYHDSGSINGRDSGQTSDLVAVLPV